MLSDLSKKLQQTIPPLKTTKHQTTRALDTNCGVHANINKLQVLHRCQESSWFLAQEGCSPLPSEAQVPSKKYLPLSHTQQSPLSNNISSVTPLQDSVRSPRVSAEFAGPAAAFPFPVLRVTGVAVIQLWPGCHPTCVEATSPDYPALDRKQTKLISLPFVLLVGATRLLNTRYYVLTLRSAALSFLNVCSYCTGKPRSFITLLLLH